MTPTNDLGWVGAAPAVPAAPPYKLYTPGKVALASFFGSPLAGAWLMALNEKRAGSKAALARIAIIGIVSTLAVMVIGFALSAAMPHAPSYGLPAAYIFGMRAWAQSAQGNMLKAHADAKGANASGWAAFGIGMLCLVFVVVVAVGVVFVGPETLRDEVTVMPGQTISYDDGATRKDAKAVGDMLKAEKVMTGSHEMDVKLVKAGKTFVLSFVVDAENAAKPSMQEAFTQIAAKSKEVLSAPAVEVWLCDEGWEPRLKLKAP